MRKGKQKMETPVFRLSACVLLALLQVKIAVSDVRLVLSIPSTATEVVAYNNSYVRAGSILSGPTDTIVYRFVLACEVTGSNQSDIGQWYYPDGSLVATSPLSVGASQERQRGRVVLYRYGCLECGAQYVGIYKCVIPDLDGVNRSLYAGVYTGTGSDRPLSTKANGGPVIVGGACEYLLTTYPHVDPPTFQLICTSSNSPATLSLWTLNGAPVPSSDTTFSYQAVTNFPISGYSNVLVVTGRMAGAYTCSVATHRIEVPGNSEGIGVDTLVGSPAIGNFTVEDSPGPPNISNVIQLATTVAVSWTPPTSGGTVRSYWIYVGGLIRSLPSNTTSVALQLSAGSRYTILIVALGRHLPSPPSPVVVEMVTPPTVSITQSQPRANAGSAFTLRCQVQFLSVPSSPVTIWWASATNPLLNSTTVQDSSALHTLEFTINPIYASDGGVYQCGVSVAKYTTSANTTVVVKVPAPLVMAKASSTFLTAGDKLQLNCTGLLPPYFNVPGQVTMTWTGPNNVFLSTVNFQSIDGGTFMNNVPQTSAQLSSAGTYTCGISVTFNTAPFLDVSSNVTFDQVTVVIIAASLSLNVKVPDTPAQLGMPYSISCAVIVPPISSNIFDLSIRFKNFDTVLKNVTIIGAINGTYESVVSFDSLSASQVQMYWCEADLGSLSVIASQGISVVVPQPNVTIVSSVGLYLVAGDALTLACVVQLDAFKYINTGAVLNITWRYPSGMEKKTSQLIPSSATPLLLSSMLQLQAGSLGDAGNYSCAVTLQPKQDSVFLTPSVPVETTVEVNVLESNLTISMVDNGPVLGYPYNLTCQVNVPAISTTHLLLQLALSYSLDASSHSIKNATIADPGNATHTLQMTLPSLSTADAGTYVCLASVGPYKVRGAKVVIVQVPPPSLTVSAEPLFFIVVQQSITLLCSGVLSSAISTDVSINVSWSGPHGELLLTEQILQPARNQKFASQLYLPSVPFFGAGNYTCFVTIIPQLSLAFVYSTYASSQVEIAIMNGNLTVAIQDNSNTPQLGLSYALQCNIDVPALSIKGQTLQIEWILFTDTSNHSLNSIVIADPGNTTHQFPIAFPYLSTADVGTYMCIGSLGPYKVNGSKVVALQVLPPTLTVSATPTDLIVAQQDLTLLCSIWLSPSIQTTTEVTVSWADPSGWLLKNETWQLHGNRNIGSKLFLPSVPFSGAGNYTCLVSVHPQPQSIYLDGVVTSSRVGIAIINGNLTATIQDNESPQIGSPYSFQCDVYVPALSMRERTLRIEWIFIIDTSFNLSLNSTVITSTGNATYLLPVSITSLSTADAGRYVCLATIGSIKVNIIKDIILRVPSPALVISASPSVSVSAGSNVTLNCCATLGTQMNGNFIMRVTWTGPDDRTWNYETLPANAALPVCAKISSVVQMPSEVYTCNATVYSSTPNFILGSIPTIKQQNITAYPEIQIATCKSSGGFIGFAKALCLLTGAPSDISANILSITNNASTLDAQDVAIIVDLLAQLVQFGKNNKQMQDDFVSIVNNILSLNKAILYESATNPQLVKTIEIFMKIVGLGENEDVRSFTQDKFVLQAQDMSTSQLQSIVVPDKSFFNPNKANPKFVTQNAFVTLPSTLFNELNITSTLPGAVRVSSSLFEDDHLFQPQQNISRHFSNYSLGSLIVSASLDIAFPVQNLKHPVQISLKLGPDAIQNGSNITCVFWDTAANNGFGDWSTQGCLLVSSNNGTAMCECNHLTSFAILFDVSPKTKSDGAIGLGVQIITFVGLAISIFCLLIVIGTYLISRKLRTSILGKMLLNLCGSLLALFAVFIASSVAPPVHILCSFLSALLHYTLLAYFLWTASEAIHLYLKLVQVFETRWLQRHYVAVSMAVCWGAPVVIVAISLSGYKDYGNEQFCRPYNLPFYIGFVMPFGIIYIFNWVMFVITFASICHHVTRNDTTAYETFKKQFKIAVTISLLLGLGWVFGFLGTSALPEEIYIPAQYFFSFFMTSQGVLFFFFHGIKSTEVRQEWMRLFYVVTGRSDKYRLHLQKSKTKSTDSTHKTGLTASKMKSKAYSVDTSHGSTDMELKVNLEKLPQKEQNELGCKEDMAESCCDAWNEEDKKEVSPSNDEQHVPSHSPEHTCINIPSENEYVVEGIDGNITFNILYMPVSKEINDNEQIGDITVAKDDSTTQDGTGVKCVESSTADTLSDQKQTDIPNPVV